MKNSRTKTIVYIIIIILAGLFLYSFGSDRFVNFRETSISEITQAVNEGKVSEIIIDGERIIAKQKGDVELRTYKELGVGLHEYGITPEKIKITIKNPERGNIWGTIFSVVLPFGLVALFLYFMMRSAQGANIRAMSFGQSRARLFMPGKERTTFKDVAGQEESKNELIEVVEFLKHPEKFRALGAEIPKGVLLVGPPGCGKTLLAKAVAGEAGVPFFTISASEFVEMFVGVGAARVRDLFQKAKRNAPSVIFIDELDAIGRQRGAGLGGSHDEREQTLNQILVEMDGFETDTRVIVTSATNRPDVLDPALLRPGRFDRRVILTLPDKNDRQGILKIHIKGKPLATDVNLEKIASATAGLSGADLKNIVNEAAIFAARENRKSIDQRDFEQSIEKVMLGPEKKSRVLPEEEKKVTAYHEGGHAIVGKLLPNCDPVHKVSIVSRGLALGYTWSLPLEDRHIYSKEKFEDDLAQMLGGRAAEKLIYNRVTTGAHNDLERATKLARDMVTVYGMSEKIGPIVLGQREELVFLGREISEHKNYSDKIAGLIDEEVSRIIHHNEQRAIEILKKHRNVLKKLSDKLLEEETVEGAEFEKLFRGVKRTRK